MLKHQITSLLMSDYTQVPYLVGWAQILMSNAGVFFYFYFYYEKDS